MKCVKYLLSCYLIVNVIAEVGSIRNNPGDKNQLTEEDRRGAEKPSEDRPTQVTEAKTSESKKRGLFLSAIHRSPTSLIHPALAIGFREPEREEHSHSHSHESSLSESRPQYLPENRPHYLPESRPQYLPESKPQYLPENKPQYSSTGSRGGGYLGHYPGLGGSSFPGEYGGGYGHNEGGLFGGHNGGGGFDYSGGGFGHGHGTGLGQHGGGGFKNPLAIKGLLLPLAGIALLGAAAALTANPVLLQLGVINGRRRRRGLIQLGNDVYPANHIIKPDKN